MYVPEMAVIWDDDELWSKVCHAGGLDSFKVVHNTVDDPDSKCRITTVEYVRDDKLYGRMTAYHFYEGWYNFMYEWQAEW